MKILRNFFLRRRVRKFLAYAGRQRAMDNDLWDAGLTAKVDGFLASGRAALRGGDVGVLAGFAASMEADFTRLVPPLPPFKAKMREYLDVMAVVLAVAFGIRGLFLQPFVIPTGSMQPTLFGIHYVERGTPYFGASEKYPGWLNQILFSAARSYAEVARSGRPDLASLRPEGASTAFDIGGVEYKLPGEPRKVLEYAELEQHSYLPAGSVLADGYLAGGDSLFVERLSHLFSGLRRGDIVVFNTSGLYLPARDGNPARPLAGMSGYYYIKRLVGLPGDTLKIADGMLYVQPAGETGFRPVTEFSAEFDKIFSGEGGYHGYRNGRQLNYLAAAEDTFTVPEDSYFMLGDNSAGSLDSRYWGVVPRRNIVGKALVVFWPFSRRWGTMDAAAIPEPSGLTPPFAPMARQ